MRKHTIDVHAVLSSVRTSASADTELAVGHEVGPLVVLVVGAERVSVDKSAD